MVIYALTKGLSKPQSDAEQRLHRIFGNLITTKNNETHNVYAISQKDWLEIERQIWRFRLIKPKKPRRADEPENEIENYLSEIRNDSDRLNFYEEMKRNDNISRRVPTSFEFDRIEFRLGYLPYQDIFKQIGKWVIGLERRRTSDVA